MTDELKPCPFCGGSVTLSRHGFNTKIFCPSCSRKVHWLTNPSKTWNTRPIEDELRAELAALRERTRWIDDPEDGGE